VGPALAGGGAKPREAAAMRRTELETWLARSARSAPRLEESLVAGRPWRYLWHRLRMVAALRGIELVIHLAEFWLLVQVWGGQRLAGAVVGHSAAAIAAAAWWGCLEVLRAEVRRLGPRCAPRVVSRWLRRAGLVALAVAAAAAIALAACAASGRLGPFELYLGALALRAAGDSVLRAYQAGIQATRRIYRPLGAVAAVELAGLAVLAALLPVFGPWSLPLAVLLSAALSRTVALHYARRAYRVARVEPPRFGRRAPAAAPTAAPAARGALLWAALAGAGSRVGSMIVIAMVAAGGARLGAEATALHLVAPLLALAATGCTTFYIDVVRLGDPLARRLASRLSAALLQAALAIALAAWTAAALLLLLAGAAGAAAGLLALFAAQSLFALAELELVARQRFRAAAALAILFALAAVAGGGTAAACAAALAIAAAHAGVSGRWQTAAPGWLEELATIEGPVAIGRATLARGVSSARALAALEARVGPRGRVALCGGRAVWFERGSAERLDRSGAAIATAGMAARIDVEPARTGAAAASRVARAGWLCERGAASVSPDELVAEFAAAFPEGLAIDLRAPSTSPLAAGLAGDVLATIWRDALVFARGGRARRSRYEVSAVVAGGSVAVVFLIPRVGPGAARSAWSARVRAADSGAVLAALRAPALLPTYPDGVLPAPHG